MPPGGIIYLEPILAGGVGGGGVGGLIEAGSLFNLETTMVSVLHDKVQRIVYW